MQQLAWMKLNTDCEITGIVSEQLEKKKTTKNPKETNRQRKKLKERKNRGGWGVGVVVVEINEGE